MVGAGSSRAGQSDAGRLVVCGAPIGDARDASPRLAAAITDAGLIAAEDTRRLRRLAAALGIEQLPPVVSYHEHNETTRTAELVARMQAGTVVALVTDAGMPAVSDPGYRLVAAAAAAGIAVGVVPGPSAVTTALAVSGLPTDRWVFEGFLPRKAGERRTRLAALAAEPRTLVLLEAPHRLPAALSDLAAAFGADRPAVVARELSKTWEEVVRRPLGELAAWSATKEMKGEITLVIGGATGTEPDLDDDALAALVAARVAAGESRRDAVDAVAATTGVARRTVYAAATRR
ncbi:MAG TPA: 16S rRNA (cytidine(1402)-2'-O)-methyltransferase [Mycobacteriales bacterium]|nr:16S rRNA (cytidine(1402)-2'-O)-methyltransferase [Mycobacteriales bacterium]